MMTTRLRFSLGLLVAASTAFLLNACLGLAGDGCTADSVPPVNVTATAGNGSATINWEIPPYDTLIHLEKVWSIVKFAPDGGSGAQCNTYDPNSEVPGCAVACNLSASTSCTRTGLTNGVSYTFTVITQGIAINPSCGNGTAFVRTQPVTPGESLISPSL